MIKIIELSDFDRITNLVYRSKHLDTTQPMHA